MKLNDRHTIRTGIPILAQVPACPYEELSSGFVGTNRSVWPVPVRHCDECSEEAIYVMVGLIIMGWHWHRLLCRAGALLGLLLAQVITV